ncbi:MAG: hypothetical protein H6502_00555 [Candidatus Woesearchaeota archaeon]|nr:MAG: hypothetical protein H6502_00555 [Candidatus Woesearchaeota archaeon]
MTRRGQAALEFLMTYGWAFGIILITISALTYYMISSPDDLVKDYCSVGLDFYCGDEFKIDFDASLHYVTVNLGHTLGVPVTIHDFWCTDPLNGQHYFRFLNESAGSIVAFNGGGINYDFSSHNRKIFNCTVEGLELGHKNLIYVDIVYSKAGGGLPQHQRGEIYTYAE